MSLEHFVRKSGYLFWTFVEQGLTLGLARFCLFPLAAHIVGKELFGEFITAYSVVAILGITPSMGLAIGILRHLTEYEEEDRPRFCKTAMQMDHWAMIIIIALALASAMICGWLGVASERVLLCVAMLSLSLYAENQFATGTTDLRVARQFRSHAGWTALRSFGISVFSIVGALLWGPVGFAAGYATGNMVGYSVLRFNRRNWMQEPYDADAARLLKSVWLHMTLASILAFSGQYLNRIILSAWAGYSVVSDLFGATSVMYLFLVPITGAGAFMTSMLARYVRFASVPRSARMQCLGLTVVGIVAGTLCLHLFGSVILHVMFPSFGYESERLLPVVIWAMPFAVLMMLSRPFVVKFAPPQVNPVINTLALAGYLIPALLLVPRYAAEGAAWAVVAGYVVHALAYVTILIALQSGWMVDHEHDAEEETLS